MRKVTNDFKDKLNSVSNCDWQTVLKRKFVSLNCVKGQRWREHQAGAEYQCITCKSDWMTGQSINWSSHGCSGSPASVRSAGQRFNSKTWLFQQRRRGQWALKPSQMKTCPIERWSAADGWRTYSGLQLLSEEAVKTPELQGSQAGRVCDYFYLSTIWVFYL